MLAVFELEAASIELLERLLAEGRMPALAELRKQGRWQQLSSTTDLFEAGLFPTLYSGIEIADHGLYYPMVWSQDKQRIRYMDGFDRPELAWERLDRAGARTLTVDPYQLWRTRRGSGVCFSGWQYRHKIIPSFFQPASLYARAVRRYGRPPLLRDISGARSASMLLEMLNILEASSARCADLVCDLMATESFDVAWINLAGIHHAGHHLWDLSQVRGGISDADRVRLEGGLADVYAGADVALGRMVEALPAGADVVVVSPLGMGANTSRSDMLPGMLARVLAGGSSQGEDGGAGEGLWSFRERLPGARQAANRILPGSAVRAILGHLYARGIDWRSARAFALPGDHFGSLRLNLRGRERDGIVEPEDAEALTEEIATGLQTFTDEGGGPSIVQVHRPQLELNGERTEMLPDLVLRWSDDQATSFDAVTSPRFGRVSRIGAGIGRPGGHWPGAFALVVPGRSVTRELGRPPDLIDLAATACSVTGENELAGESLFE